MSADGEVDDLFEVLGRGIGRGIGKLLKVVKECRSGFDFSCVERLMVMYLYGLIGGFPTVVFIAITRKICEEYDRVKDKLMSVLESPKAWFWFTLSMAQVVFHLTVFPTWFDWITSGDAMDDIVSWNPVVAIANYLGFEDAEFVWIESFPWQVEVISGDQGENPIRTSTEGTWFVQHNVHVYE